MFDGSYVYFPPRYGQGLSKNVQVTLPGRFPKTPVFPDSQSTTSYFDYRWGDFLYDELEVGVTSAAPSRMFSMTGFKRSFAGRKGQYIQPAKSGPAQQSYRLDYSSKSDLSQVNISAARLVTDSGIPDDSITGNGFYKDLITSAGILWQASSERWDWTIHGSQFNQKLRINRTTYQPAPLHLGRTHLHLQVKDREYRFPMDRVGLELGGQTVKDSLFRNLRWATFYAGRSETAWDAKVGFTLPAGLSDAQIYALLDVSFKLGGWQWNSNASIETIPVHYSDWKEDSGSDYETWYSGKTELGKQFSRISISSAIFTGVRETKSAGFGKQFLSGTISLDWNLFRKWYFLTRLSLTPDPGLITDGVGRRVIIGLQGQEFLFREKMIARIRIWAESYNSREHTLWFDPVRHRNEIITSGESFTEDYTVLNFEFAADISTVTIKYRVLNVLNALYPSLTGMFPDMSEESVLFRGNPYLPVMGRLVNFTVTWHFQN